MIHVVTPRNRALYVRELLQLHRLRAARSGAAVDPARASWGAYDRGDDDQAVYFLALDDGGVPECGGRLRPTADWSVIAEAAPHLIAPDGPIALGPQVWELDGLLAVPQRLSPEPANVRRLGQLRLAILEEAQERGLDRIVTIVESARLPSVLRGGWRLRLVGLPWEFQGRAVVAVEIDCSAEAVHELRERLGVESARRLNLPGHQSLGEAPLKEVELFLEAAQRLGPNQLKPLLVALRAAIEEEEAER